MLLPTAFQPLHDQIQGYLPLLRPSQVKGQALWAAIRRQGWHPYMRYDRNMTFQATTGPRGPAWRFVAREGQYTVTAGKAFRDRKRSCTLIVLRVPGQEHPWVVLTDEAPDDVELDTYGLRVWIEQGFRTPGAWAGSGTAPAVGTPPASTTTGWSWPWPRSGCWPTARAWRRPACAVGPRTRAQAAPAASHGVPPPTAPCLPGGPGPGPAAPAPRLRLGAGLAAAPPRTGSALGPAGGGPARTGPNGRTLTRGLALPTPIRPPDPRPVGSA